MTDTEKTLQSLQEELRSVEAKAEELRQRIAALQKEQQLSVKSSSWPMPLGDYERYGRQIIVPNVGVAGQLHLKNSKVLIVGAGGLGCPAAAYLAGAGVGTLGLVDGDTVEESNLHRQIAHAISRVGMLKVESAIQYLRGLNPHVEYRKHAAHLIAETATQVIRQYDIVLDCTDHPTSRYLVSDACVLLQKPLIFASALKLSGQLMVMNYPARPQGESTGGPCYRCAFPKPSPPESMVSCGEGGILGPVVGTMGVLQALEALKIITSEGLDITKVNERDHGKPSMLLFTANSSTPFRSIRMMGRRPKCFACGPNSTLTIQSLIDGSMDYVQFCGISAPVNNILNPDERIGVAGFRDILQSKKHILFDVRGAEHFSVGALNGAISLPISTISDPQIILQRVKAVCPELDEKTPIYVICRQGEDSQVAVRKLKEAGLDFNGTRPIMDIEGGMRSWKYKIDNGIPFL